MAASSARANHQLETAAQAAQSAVVAHGNKLRGASSLGRPDVASEVRNAASLASRALVEAGGSRQAGAAVRQAVEAGGRLLMPSLESNQTIHLDHHQPEQRDDAAMDQRNASSGLGDAMSVVLTACRDMVHVSPHNRAYNTATFDNARASADDKFPIDEGQAGGQARRRTSGLIASVESSDQSNDIANSNGNSNMSNSKSKSKLSRRSSGGILSCSNRGDGASGMSSRSQACPPNRSRSPWFTSELNSGLAPAQVGNGPSVDEGVVEEFFQTNLIPNWDDSVAVETRITKDEYSDVGQLLGIFTPLPKTESQDERELCRDVNMTDVLPRGDVSWRSHGSGLRRGDDSTAAMKVGLCAAIPGQVSVSVGTAAARCSRESNCTTVATSSGDTSNLNLSMYGDRSGASSLSSAFNEVPTSEGNFPDHACFANDRGSYEGALPFIEGIKMEAVPGPARTSDRRPARITKKLSLILGSGAKRRKKKKT
ncbi:hypothetical protein THAOC_02481 [Thalassiosira oceanica]|uniref:Uncharacterized protein n=1 Tax=Thalassiosira oceanica TaxID=159749 RepID=K0TM13_THAOC|nr:hypothetical protein THAOC_02481 [Thalassiosira oceanica]|eukprot:EJK75786.1 hypothetical protein THAOC_02481 [Thalassiosira oceanica]